VSTDPNDPYQPGGQEPPPTGPSYGSAEPSYGPDLAKHPDHGQPSGPSYGSVEPGGYGNAQPSYGSQTPPGYGATAAQAGYGAGPGYGGGPPGYAPGGMGQPSKVLAIVSMACGILGSFFFWCGFISTPLGIAALVTGLIALSKIKQGQADGHGLALTGVITGGVAVLLTILWIANMVLGSGFYSY